MSHRLRDTKRLAVSLLTLTSLLPALALAQTPAARTQQPKPAAPKTTAAAATSARLAGYARLPLAFEPNVGQTDRRVRFLTHTAKGTLFLTDTEAVLTLPVRPPAPNSGGVTGGHGRLDAKQRNSHGVAVLRMKLIGAHKPASALALAPLPGVVNYLRGNNPKQWHTNIPTYGRARFAGVYKGVDMVYYGTQGGKLEYDFVVKPDADPKAIRLAFSGATGARVTAEGELRLQTAAGEVRWQRPVTYQITNGHRETVACAYELKREGGLASVGFRLARYDASRPVVIDPVLQYSTFLGGYGGENGNAIAVDSSGNAYITGHTCSSNFPVSPSAFQTTNGEDPVIPGNPPIYVPNAVGNAFVTKLNAVGTQLVYSTYLGGTDSYGDFGNAIAIDSGGNAYVAGNTYCTDFPTTPGAFQTTTPPSQNYDITDGNAFVTKLNPTGTGLIYSTLMGGADGDCAYCIAVDSAGSAYVTGYSYSPNWPNATAGTPGYQPTNSGYDYTYGVSDTSNAFVTKLNATGTGLIYFTYLGGTGDTPLGDAGLGIALDSSDNAYVTGYTFSADFPTNGAFQPNNAAYAGGLSNAFVTELNAAGAGLVYSTYLGGSGGQTLGDYGYGIALDSGGNVYVTGFTQSSNFPTTAAAFQPNLAVGADNGTGGNAFVTKFSAGLAAPAYSTYLGGSGANGDSGNSIAVDSSGNAYITGYTSSTNFPITGGTFQPTNYDATDGNAFLTELNASGSFQVYSTYLGGSGSDYGAGIALDSDGNVYLTGSTASPGSVIATTATSAPDFPVTDGAFQTTNNGYDYNNDITVTTNAFVTMFALPSLTRAKLTFSKTSVLGGASVTGTVTLGATAPANGETVYLGSANPAVASAPATVAVKPGSKTATFTITTVLVATNTPVALSASLAGENATATLTVNPAGVSSLALSPTSVTGGANSTGTVTLTASAPTGGTTVTLTSGNAAATVPTSVTVAAGATKATFTISTTAVGSATTAAITAAVATTSASANLTIEPAGLKSFTLSPTSVTGGATSKGTVTLAAVAPTGGTTVTLTSGNTSVATVPVSVTVAGGSKTATFTITSLPVASVATVSISASLGAVTKSANLTVKPAALSSVTLSPASVKGGATSKGTVTLTGIAPAGGTTVTLTSGTPTVATVPVSITVAGGSKTATFTVTSLKVTAKTTSVITATLGTVSKTATLTVTP